ncbi:MAG: hypothetical protein HC898_13315 [Phycisphaerales bacterium]|nr:hypothetical protein [Phycisphaerales bacterium]
MSSMITTRICTLAVGVVSLTGIAQGSPANLIANGGFESGNNGFSTSLKPTPYDANVLTAPGTYGIYEPGRTNWHNSWNEPTPSEGNRYMIINAAAPVNNILQPVDYLFDWKQDHNLLAGEYEFLFDAITIYKPVTILNTMVVGDDIYMNFTISTPTPDSGNGPTSWQTHSTTFYLPSNQNVKLTIKNTSLKYTGDDYGLDNIRLYAIPLPAPAWAGMSTLAGMGGLAFLRRRKAQQAV